MPKELNDLSDRDYHVGPNVEEFPRMCGQKDQGSEGGVGGAGPN